MTTIPKNPLSRAYLAISALFFLLGFGGANWLSRVPRVRAELGLDDRALGFLLLCSGLGAVVAFRTAGFWSARLPTRRLATLSMATLGGVLWLPAASSWPLLAGSALAIGGYASGLLDIAVNANAVLLERGRGRPVLSRLHGFCSLGSFAGASVGTLAATCNISPVVHLGVVGAAMVAIGLLGERGLMADESAPTKAAATIQFTPRLVLLGAVAFCSSVGEGGMAQWTALLLAGTLHTSDAFAGFGFAVYCAAMVAGRLIGDRLTARWSAPTLLWRSGLFAGGSLCAALLIATPYATVFCLAGVGLGLSLIIPAVFRSATAVGTSSPSAVLGRVATLSYGGFLFGPPTIGLLAQAFGLRTALFLIVVLCVVLAGLGQFVATPPPQKAQ